MKHSIHDESSMSNASDETPEGIAYYFICLLLSIFREYYLIFHFLILHFTLIKKHIYINILRTLFNII